MQVSQIIYSSEGSLLLIYGADGCICEAYSSRSTDFIGELSFLQATHFSDETTISIMAMATGRFEFLGLLSGCKGKEVLKPIPRLSSRVRPTVSLESFHRRQTA